MAWRPLLALLVLAAAVLLVAVQFDEPGANGASAAADSDLATLQCPATGPHLHVQLTKSAYAPGEPVHGAVWIVNGGNETLRVEPGMNVHMTSVYRVAPDGSMERLSAGGSATSSGPVLEVPPGEAVLHEGLRELWTGNVSAGTPADPGTYVIVPSVDPGPGRNLCGREPFLVTSSA